MQCFCILSLRNKYNEIIKVVLDPHMLHVNTDTFPEHKYKLDKYKTAAKRRSKNKVKTIIKVVKLD